MREFTVTPPGTVAWIGLTLLLAVPLVLMAAGLTIGEAWQEPSAWLAPALLVPVAVGLPWLLRRRRVALRDHTLIVQAGFNTRRVDVRELALDKARVVDLDERIELQPVLRGLGTGLPGFRAGWFISRGDFSRMFCLLTDRHRVLWLPLRDGPGVLLSLQQPRQLLDALNTLAPPSH